MTRLDEVLAQLRRDHTQGRITADERSQLWREAEARAKAGRSAWDHIRQHARDRSR